MVILRLESRAARSGVCSGLELHRNGDVILSELRALSMTGAMILIMSEGKS